MTQQYNKRRIKCNATIKNSGRKSDRPTASMSKTGVLSINTKSMELLGNPSYIIVDVDDDQGIVFLSASRKHPHAFTVSGERSRIKVAELKSWHGAYRVSADPDDATAVILKRDYTK